MSNYSRYRSRRSYSSNNAVWDLVLIIFIALLLLIGTNACTAKEWNNGTCPDCHTRYELRGVYKGTYYYACPECGNEVHRFGGK